MAALASSRYGLHSLLMNRIVSHVPRILEAASTIDSADGSPRSACAYAAFTRIATSGSDSNDFVHVGLARASSACARAAVDASCLIRRREQWFEHFWWRALRLHVDELVEVIVKRQTGCEDHRLEQRAERRLAEACHQAGQRVGFEVGPSDELLEPIVIRSARRGRPVANHVYQQRDVAFVADVAERPYGGAAHDARPVARILAER